MDEHVAEIRGDLTAALGASTRAAFAGAQSFLTAGVRTLVEDGLKQCVEQLREAGCAQASEAQAREYRPPIEATAMGGLYVERYTAENWGTLRALERLKAFCTSSKPPAADLGGQDAFGTSFPR